MFEYRIPDINLILGRGAIRQLASVVKGFGEHALVVTGRASMKKLGILDRVLEDLRKVGVRVTHHGGVSPNPSVEIVDKGAAVAAEAGCDVVVGLGGGSAIDTAKAIAVMLAHPRASSIWDFSPTNQDPTPIESAFPIIAVPSTSGTGSHQTPYYVITNTGTGEKPGNGHRSIFPRLAIVDLDIVSSMPPQLTAETGFDVMAHALEGLVSANANDISDIHALTAIELVWTYLPRAYKNGDDEEARERMAIADSLAGWVLSVADTTLPHAISHPISGFYPGVSHGMSLAILTPAAMRFTIDRASQETLRRLGRAAERMGAGMGTGSAAHCLEQIQELLERIGLTKRLGDFGVEEGRINEVAESCLSAMSEDLDRSPVRPSFEEIVGLYREAL